MSESYVNPNEKGDFRGPQGNVTSPKIPGGSKQGVYDNAANTTKAKTDGTSTKPVGRSAPSSGRDDAGINGDFGISGHPKKRSSNI